MKVRSSWSSQMYKKYFVVLFIFLFISFIVQYNVVVNYKMTSTINHETKQTYFTVLQPAHKYLNARRFDVIVKSVYA